MGDVRDDRAANRYELATDDGAAIAAYQREGDAIVFTHTEVPEALKGQGIGSRLVRGALADARRQGLRIVPRCAFVAAYLKRHPQEAA